MGVGYAVQYHVCCFSLIPCFQTLSSLGQSFCTRTRNIAGLEGVVLVSKELEYKINLTLKFSCFHFFRAWSF